MICRNINLSNLDDFDFVNDARDTILWLRSCGRDGDAVKLQDAFNAWENTYMEKFVWCPE